MDNNLLSVSFEIKILKIILGLDNKLVNIIRYYPLEMSKG